MNKIQVNNYEQKYLTRIINSKSNEELIDIINKIYDDGFTDGEDNAQNI